MSKLRLALIYGGISSEREVSLSSGREVFEALDKSKYDITVYDPKTDIPKLVSDAATTDAALIILHGPYGEDGTIQGMLDLLGIPYQGSGVLGSAVAMSKITSKKLYQQASLPIPEYIEIHKNGERTPEKYIDEIGIPMVVKPASGGSSIGMSIVRDAEKLSEAIDKGFMYDEILLLEKCIDGIELTCGVIGNSDLETLPVIEIIPGKESEFFDYEAKYTPGVTEEICPARIDDELTKRVQELAKEAHRTLFCKGYSRTDFILKERELYILETNTIPGMTANSLLPLAARTAGMSFSGLLDKLIQLAMENSI